MATSRTLRFGVLCNGTTFREWQALCIQNLLADKNLKPALLIIDGRPPLPSRPLIARLGTVLRFRTNLFSLYSRYYVNPRARASRPVDLSSAFSGVPELHCVVTKRGKFSEYFTPDDVAAIRTHNLDFILRFAFGIIRGDVLSAARYGVWSFHHGDEQRYRGAPPCFWEIVHDDPCTGAILQRLTETLDGGVILKKAVFPTVLDSYVRNRDAAHYAGTIWPAEVCHDILSGRTEYLEAAPVKTSAPIYKEPANADMLRFAGKQFTRGARRWLRLQQPSSRLVDQK